jgi:signal transduction histidine kinase
MPNPKPALYLAALCLLLLAQSALAVETRNVLVLYSNNRLVPGNVAVDRGLRAAIRSSADQPVQLFSEFLDRPEFSGPAYEATVMAYLREKYAERPPDAIVSVSDEALDFLLRNRANLFAHVPVVHAVASRATLGSYPARGADVVGVPLEYDFSGTIVQALRWHPAARRLVIVTGTAERDRAREAWLRREVPRIAGDLTIEYLAGLPTSAVLERLSRLSADSVVFTPGYFRDGDGGLFNPRDAAGLMAAASGAPVYGPFDPFIGTGVVGGRMPSFEAIGEQAGRIVNAIFAGAAPGSIQLPEITPTKLQVDWRQVKRWGIDERDIPPDTVVHYRDPTFWEKYRNVAIVTLVVILLQAALIAKLLLERRARRAAELAVQRQRTELAHASRLAVAGELTASIAHEINQPLGAVQTSADAADLILKSGADRREDLLRIVTRIRRDNLRASDVIRRLRALLARQEGERKPFDVSAALSDVATILAPARAAGLRACIGANVHRRRRNADPAGIHQSAAQCDGQRRGHAGGAPIGRDRRRPKRAQHLDHRARSRSWHRAGIAAQALRFLLQHESQGDGPRPVDRPHDRRGARRANLGREQRTRRRRVPCGAARAR